VRHLEGFEDGLAQLAVGVRHHGQQRPQQLRQRRQQVRLRHAATFGKSIIFSQGTVQLSRCFQGAVAARSSCGRCGGRRADRAWGLPPTAAAPTMRVARKPQALLTRCSAGGPLRCDCIMTVQSRAWKNIETASRCHFQSVSSVRSPHDSPYTCAQPHLSRTATQDTRNCRDSTEAASALCLLFHLHGQDRRHN